MQDKSIIFKTMETNFKLYPSIKREFIIILNERKYDYKTGGKHGKALIKDETANKAIKELEPPYIARLYVDCNDDKGGIHTRRINNPFKWLQLFEWVRDYSCKDKIKKAVFEGRYIRKEAHTTTILSNGFSEKTYFNARNDILHTALAAACQLGLVKVM